MLLGTLHTEHERAVSLVRVTELIEPCVFTCCNGWIGYCTIWGGGYSVGTWIGCTIWGGGYNVGSWMGCTSTCCTGGIGGGNSAQRVLVASVSMVSSWAWGADGGAGCAMTTGSGPMSMGWSTG